MPAICGQELQHDAIAPAKAGLHAVLALAARLSWPLRIQLLKLNNHAIITYERFPHHLALALAWRPRQQVCAALAAAQLQTPLASRRNMYMEHSMR